MTIHYDTASTSPLRTERDKVTRIRDLLAPASDPGQLWALLLDADGFQTPVMFPISDIPDLPDVIMVDSVIDILGEVSRDIPGSPHAAMFVIERFGPFGADEHDHCWAAALSGACARGGLAHAGTFLLSPGGVSAVAQP